MFLQNHFQRYFSSSPYRFVSCERVHATMDSYISLIRMSVQKERASSEMRDSSSEGGQVSRPAEPVLMGGQPRVQPSCSPLLIFFRWSMRGRKYSHQRLRAHLAASGQGIEGLGPHLRATLGQQGPAYEVLSLSPA